jgi:hypothetical protein
VQGVFRPLLSKLLLVLATLCGGQPISDLRLALVHRPDQRWPDELHGEPNEHREGHQLGN